MRVQKPTTPKGWTMWIAGGVLAAVAARIAYPILDLNIQTWAEAKGIDKMWAWRPVDPMAAGLGWWIAVGTLLIGLIVGMSVDGWSRRLTRRAVPTAPVPKPTAKVPQAPTSPSRAPDQTGPVAPVIKGTSPAYRTAVLQIEKMRPELEANSNRIITKSSCAIDLKNVTQQELERCTVVLVSIGTGGKETAVGEALRPGEFSAPRSGTKGIPLVRRDRTDIISNPPHLIRTVGRDIALEEGASYLLQFELRSQYPYPTLATVQIDVPDDPNMAVVPTIISQDVDRA